MKQTLSLLLALMMLLALTACGAGSGGAFSVTREQTTATASDAGQSSAAAPSAAAVSTPAAEDLSGKALMIYCGAGMKEPFAKIAAAFEAETGCAMQVTYANAGQIQSQIGTAQEGDLFLAGSADEVKPVASFVTASVDLVKHIPVLAVAAGNPKGITGLADLTKEGVAVVLGDGEATPIGKVANKALTDLGILEKVNVIARQTTAPAIANALTMGQCDAVIVWKENATDKAVEVVKTADLDKYVKTVPAASLSFTRDSTARDAFLDYLGSDAAKEIWTGFGYETLN